MVSQLLIKEVGSAGRQTSKEVGKFSFEVLGYNFVDLATKLSIFFIVAILIDKIHFAITSAGVNVAVTIANIFGYNLPTADQEPDFFKKLFGEGYFGLKYWDLIKILAIVLTFISFINYIESEKARGGKPDPFTLGIFLLIMTLLSAFTVPELIQKLKTRTPNQVTS